MTTPPPNLGPAGEPQVGQPNVDPYQQQPTQQQAWGLAANAPAEASGPTDSIKKPFAVGLMILGVLMIISTFLPWAKFTGSSMLLDMIQGEQTSFNGRYNDLTGTWVMIAGIVVIVLGGALRERKLPAVGALGAAGVGLLGAFFAFLSIGKIGNISDQIFGSELSGLDGLSIALSPTIGIYVAIGLGVVIAALGAYAYQQRISHEEEATGVTGLQTPTF